VRTKKHTPPSVHREFVATNCGGSLSCISKYNHHFLAIHGDITKTSPKHHHHWQNITKTSPCHHLFVTKTSPPSPKHHLFITK
jgi:hypothetical protein